MLTGTSIVPFTIPRLRWYIGGLLFLSTVINYVDRQALSVLAPYLKTEYSWTNTDFAMIVIAFRVAYSIGQTVAGTWLDRVGTRQGLSAAVLWYSTASMLFHGPRRRMISVLNSPMIDSASALSYESPQLPTDGRMSHSASRSL